MSVRFWPRAQRGFARLLGFELKHNQNRYWDALRATLRPGDRWLDVGCGHQIVPEFAATAEEQRELAARASAIAGIDLDAGMAKHRLLALRAFASGEALPFADRTFDLATANMVVEHLREPAKVFAEIRRVLRPGGRFLFHTPNYRYPAIFIASLTPDGLKRRVVNVLESRDDEDIFPTLYRANTPEAVRAAFAASGLEEERIEIGGSVGTLAGLGPLGLLEIPYLRLLSTRALERYNVSIVAIGRRPE